MEEQVIKTRQEYYSDVCGECEKDTVSKSFKQFLCDEYAGYYYVHNKKKVYKVESYDSVVNRQITRNMLDRTYCTVVYDGRKKMYVEQ